jgi:hypothetical protein
LLVETPYRLFGDRAIRVIHEREATRPACLAVYGKNDLTWFADTRQVLSQLWLVCRVWQVADKQTD